MNKNLISAAVAAALCIPAAGFAATGVQFSETGNAPGAQVDVFTWVADNILFNDLFTPGRDGTILAQARLGAVSFSGDGSSHTISSSLAITFQFSIPVHSTAPSSTSVDFTLIGTDVGFFKIYADASPNVNQQTGAGYGSAGGIDTGQILILTGSIHGVTGINVSNAASDTGTHYLSGQGTGTDTNAQKAASLGFTGGATFDINVSSANSSYFRSDISSLAIDMSFSSGTISVPVPFTGTQPKMSDNVVGTDAMGDLGDAQPLTVTNQAGQGAFSTSVTLPLNDFACFNSAGIGDTSPCDMHLKISSSDMQVSENHQVPEPSSLLLLGLGLGVAGVGIRRRRRAI